MAKLLGVVMCGGQSKRMGRDKGLLPIQDTTWARFVAAKLVALQLPVVASVNASQVEAYSQLFPPENLIVDQLATLEGPLQGMLSVHQQFPDNDILLIACDMIDMAEDTLALLIAAYQADASFDFYAFESDDYLEPFGAIYTSTGLSAVMEAVAAGDLKNFGMMRILKAGNTKILPTADSSSFRNYNTL